MSKKYIVNWEITRNCNLNCIYCRVRTKEEYSELTTAKAKKAILSFKKMGFNFLQLTGGEPLIRNDFDELVKYAKSLAFKFTFITNGLLLNRFPISFYKNNIDLIAVSLDSKIKQQNELLGRKGFSKVVKTLKELSQQEIPLVIDTTLTRININDFHYLIDLAKEINAYEIRVNDVLLEGKAEEKKDLALKETNEELIAKLQAVVKKKLDENLKIEHLIPCECRENLIFVDYQGCVYPCVELSFISSQFKLGNIFDDNLDKINKRLKKFVSQIDDNDLCKYSYLKSPHFSACLNKKDCPQKLLDYIKIAKDKNDA